MAHHDLPHLRAGDRVAVIAPASRCNPNVLSQLLDLLESWCLKPHVFEPIFGDDILCANTDAMRFFHLKQALLDPELQGVICVRGGYGSTRLLSLLQDMPTPCGPKVFLGMSDITALHLFFQQQWGWPTYHAGLTRDKFTMESILATKALLFGESQKIVYPLIPLNEAARQTTTLHSCIIGGNLSLIQASIGTFWQMNARHKIIFMEEIGERGYRIDRMLEHLRQAGLFEDVDAIVFGDCLEGNEPNGSCLIDPVLSRFAQQTDTPVVRVHGIGHGTINHPLPLGVAVRLQLGARCQLLF